MCPPVQPPPADIGLYWRDDDVFLLLDKYSRDSCLPNNVLAEASPYQYPPSNLPEGIWYLIQANEKRESVFGFWRAKGEASKIYSNSAISGWRTTLEYFEGQSPNGQRTDWLMQEYKITQNEVSKDKTKEPKSLCRVFLCSGHDSENETNSNKTFVDSKKMDSVSIIPQTNIIASGGDSRSESKEKKTSEKELLPPEADKKSNSSTEGFSELECFLRGDYLELNDLEEEPESHSSSSQNSSCPSKLSDEYFDSLALLRDLEEEDSKYMQETHSSSRYSFTTSIRPNDVVLQPASLGSVLTGGGNTSVVESPETSLKCNERSPDTRVKEQITKRHKPEGRNGGTSSSSEGVFSSPDQKNETPNREKKAGSSKRKKLKLYFCFRPF